MMDVIKTFWTNLEKWQRITVVVVFQAIFILIITATLNFFISSDRNHIDVIDNSNQIANMPNAAKDVYEDALWEIIKTNVDDVDKNVIKDVQVRDGSYKEETVNDDGVVQAGFIVDIDSIKQTYRVVISWDKNGSNVMEAIVDCPVVGESKYPESFCKGTYRGTDDLSLYLPYAVYPGGIVDPNTTITSTAPNYRITGDEDSKVIDVLISYCDADKYKKEALNYLESIPIDLSKYKINYIVNSIDVVCDGGENV